MFSKVEPKDFNVGDKYYECESGYNLELTVLTKPVKSDKNSWTWKAIDDSGKEVDYRLTEGMEHYGPRLYSTPQYCSLNGEGGFVFKTIHGKIIETVTTNDEI
ncbi:MAG: hypothetical protein GY928_29720 [Colwellia sp.]|nr:hypothetical protein [Colwellia sp.]